MTRPSSTTPLRWHERLMALGYHAHEPSVEDWEKGLVMAYTRTLRPSEGRRKTLTVTLYRNSHGTWMCRVDTHMKVGRSLLECTSWLGPFSDAAIYPGVYEIEIAAVEAWEHNFELSNAGRYKTGSDR